MKKSLLSPIVTLGSPYGIGYEIALRSYHLEKSLIDNQTVFIGSKRMLDLFNKDITYINLPVECISYSKGKSFNFTSNNFKLIDIDNQKGAIKSLNDITPEIDGYIAYNSISIAAELIDKGLFSSMVTLPVSKSNINITDKKFKGHTEFLMSLWKEKNVFMTFISDKLNVFLLSTHISLKKVPSYIKSIDLEYALSKAVKLSEQMKVFKPLCLLGLNPHAGEGGLIGNDELKWDQIVNKINNKSKIEIVGPVPSDTAFTEFNRQKYGFYVALYHDQGLIPFKMLSFDDGVNLSYGMKYIRTSVDHGTAVDLIGKNKASITSFINAYELAKILT